MMRTAPTVKQATIARALRAAKQVGAKTVTVEPDGRVAIVIEDETPEPQFKIRPSECPVKRVVF